MRARVYSLSISPSHPPTHPPTTPYPRQRHTAPTTTRLKLKMDQSLDRTNVLPRRYNMDRTMDTALEEPTRWYKKRPLLAVVIVVLVAAAALAGVLYSRELQARTKASASPTPSISVSPLAGWLVG